MNTDPIADLLTRIRNANNANLSELTAPHSAIKENVLKVMKQYGFIDEFKVDTIENRKYIILKLKEDRRNMTIRRVSSPGQRIYIKNSDIKVVKSGLGIQIISTSKGVISNVEARKQNLGGEVLCEIY